MAITFNSKQLEKDTQETIAAYAKFGAKLKAEKVAQAAKDTAQDIKSKEENEVQDKAAEATKIAQSAIDTAQDVKSKEENEMQDKAVSNAFEDLAIAGRLKTAAFNCMLNEECSVESANTAQQEFLPNNGQCLVADSMISQLEQ